jgi:hypothetical protein
MLGSSISDHSRAKERKRTKYAESAEKLVNWTLERQYQLSKELSVSSGEEATETAPIGIGTTDCGRLIMRCNAKGMPHDHNERVNLFQFRGST